MKTKFMTVKENVCFEKLGMKKNKRVNKFSYLGVILI